MLSDPALLNLRGCGPPGTATPDGVDFRHLVEHRKRGGRRNQRRACSAHRPCEYFLSRVLDLPLLTLPTFSAGHSCTRLQCQPQDGAQQAEAARGAVVWLNLRPKPSRRPRCPAPRAFCLFAAPPRCWRTIPCPSAPARQPRPTPAKMPGAAPVTAVGGGAESRERRPSPPPPGVGPELLRRPECQPRHGRAKRDRPPSPRGRVSDKKKLRLLMCHAFRDFVRTVRTNAMPRAAPPVEMRRGDPHR